MLGEGELALPRQHLETAFRTSASWVGDHDVLAMLTDVAALDLDEAAIRQYVPQAEELTVRYDMCYIKPLFIVPGEWRTGWQVNILKPRQG